MKLIIIFIIIIIIALAIIANEITIITMKQIICDNEARELGWASENEQLEFMRKAFEQAEKDRQSWWCVEGGIVGVGKQGKKGG